jgi:RNAse (barnase) inhibitor barstar
MKKEILFDLRAVKSEQDFHELAAKAFSFPSYYGKNKDAFWDCLTDLAGNIEVRLLGYDDLPAHVRSVIREYVDMLKVREIETKGAFSVRFE